MGIDFFKRLLTFVILCAVQVLFLNRIHLYGIATPLLCVYFVLKYRENAPRWANLTWAFLMGVVLDSFSNTPGVSSASLTLAAALQPYVLHPFVPRDTTGDLLPSVHSLGAWRFFNYSAILVLVYMLTFFSLEMFSLANWLYWLECVFSSFGLTLLLLMVLEYVGKD